MTDLLERGVVLNEIGAELPHPHDVGDEAIQGISLETLNITAAVSLGIRVGQDAILQVLRGGSGPLGPERNR